MMYTKNLVPILISLLVVSCKPTALPGLSPFKSDGCSCFPEGTLKHPDLWKEDCLIHDYAYWQGGTRAERKEADQKLREEIRSKGKPIIANLAYMGVRVGGVPWLPTPWRWGFGWNKFPRGYRARSDEEMTEIERLKVLAISTADEPMQRQSEALSSTASSK